MKLAEISDEKNPNLRDEVTKFGLKVERLLEEKQREVLAQILNRVISYFILTKS